MTSSRRSNQHAERIAVLEAQMAEVRTSQGAILRKQEEILTELSRYRGAFGTVLLILSAVGTALMFFKDAILTKLGMKP